MTLPFDEPGVELLQSAIQHAKAVGVDEAELQSAREQLPVLERAAARADRERAAALRPGQHATSAVPACPGARMPPGSLPVRGPPGRPLQAALQHCALGTADSAPFLEQARGPGDARRAPLPDLERDDARARARERREDLRP